jgi:hypothetical protein
MAANQNHDIPNDMKEIYRRFVQWRSSHIGRFPIPEPLWTAAAEVGRKRGINATAKVLHLEYGKLKDKSLALKKGTVGERSQATRPSRRKSPPRPPAFVELFAPPSSGDSLERRVELEGRRGKMRIEFKGIATAELVALGRALWDGEAGSRSRLRCASWWRWKP